MPIYLLLIVFLLWQPVARSQTNFRFISYSINEGLSSNNVLNFFQDSKGFIWVCTQDGFNRFDGIRFKKYQRLLHTFNTVISNNIKQLHEDAQNRLWVLTSSGGISILDMQTDSFTAHLRTDTSKRSATLSSNRTRALIQASDGNYWISSNGGLSIYNPDAKKFLRVENYPVDSLAGIQSNTLSEDAYGRIWVGTYNQGILIFDIKTRRLIKKVSAKELAIKATEEYGVEKIVRDGNGTLWICTGNGLRRILINTDGSYKVLIKPFKSFALPVDSIPVRCLLKDRNGYYWIGTSAGLLYTDGDFKKQVLITHDPLNPMSLINDRVESILQDDRGIVWIGTYGGVSKYDVLNQKFITYEKDPLTGRNLDGVYGVFTDNDQELFVCTRFGLFVVDKQTSHIIPVAIGQRKQSTTFYHVFRHIDGKLWAGSNDGIYVLIKTNGAYRLDDPEKFYPELKTVKQNYMNAHCYLNDSLLAFGSDYVREGLIVWNMRSHKVHQYLPKEHDSTSLLDEYITFIYKDRKQNIWCGTDVGIARFDVSKGIFKNYRVNFNLKGALNSNDIYDCYDDGNKLWFATYGGGLNIFDREHETFTAITSEEGLCANTLYCILPDDKGNIWVSSNYGISRVNTATLKIDNYYYEDGLQSNAFDNWGACKYKGLLYFGGMHGVAQINPEALITNAKPPLVYITRVNYYYNGLFYPVATDEKKELVIKHGQDIVTFDFTALNYTNANKNRYLYKLENFDNDWIDNENNTRATYTHLPPGKYVFKVKAANNENVWNELGAAQKIYIVPFFRQTWWFKMIIILAAVAVLYGLYRYRITQILKLENLRRKISGDLHDDIGSTLGSINIYSELAKKTKDNRSYIDAIQENTRAIVTNLDELVWNINPKNDIARNLVERMRSFSVPLLSGKNIICHFATSVVNKELVVLPDWRRNFYLAFKEIVNNVIKHSECTNCTIYIAQKGKAWVLRVSDDGKGFDYSTVNHHRNGLHNLHRRAAQMKGIVSIQSAPGKGTTVEFKVSI